MSFIEEMTENRYEGIGILAWYSGGHVFDSRPGGRVSWPLVFLSLSRLVVG
jgi:hypothetical protein